MPKKLRAALAESLQLNLGGLNEKPPKSCTKPWPATVRQLARKLARLTARAVFEPINRIKNDKLKIFNVLIYKV